MRRLITTVLLVFAGIAACAWCFGTSAPASSAQVPKHRAVEAKVRVYVDGRSKKLDPPAIIRDGKTYLGLRGVAKVLGASTRWDNRTKTAIVTLGNKRARIAQSKGIMVGNVLFLPLRTTGEALGCTVQWDKRARAVRITKEGPPPNCYG